VHDEKYYLRLRITAIFTAMSGFTMNNAVVPKEYIDDWSTVDTNGFIDHELINILWSDHAPPLTIACVSTLSPLDMMNLSDGSHDATGHRVWMGVQFFVEALRSGSMQLLTAFQNNSILELGCGTGLGSIVLLLHEHLGCRKVLLTDNDTAVLDLCLKNCQHNLDPSDTRWSIAKLDWGKESNILCGKVDTILAADVLYDIVALDAILMSVCQYLSPNGHFVLSHVPRASLPGHGKVATSEQLEDYIVGHAMSLGLALKQLIRPSDLTCIRNKAIQEMQEAGAAILLFQLIKSC